MRAKADLLSILSSMGLASSCLRSPTSQANQTPWVDADVAATYSTSHDDMATTCCLSECQRLDLRKNNTGGAMAIVDVAGLVVVVDQFSST
jgi:hypothetical protein